MTVVTGKVVLVGMVATGKVVLVVVVVGSEVQGQAVLSRSSCTLLPPRGRTPWRFACTRSRCRRAGFSPTSSQACSLIWCPHLRACLCARTAGYTTVQGIARRRAQCKHYTRRPASSGNSFP